MQTQTLDIDGARIVYDVRDPEPIADVRPPLLMIGQPMTADGFATLASYFPDRTVVTYDPRGLGRSTRSDGSTLQTPERQADDLHAVVAALGAGPVDVFASSGGAVTALAWVVRHAGDVHTLVAHEPPLLPMLPDADRAATAWQAVKDTYQQRGSGAGMAHFIAFAMYQGEYPADFAAQPAPDPAMFGLPTEDDGARDDPLLTGSDAIAGYRPDIDAILAAPARVVLAVGKESAGTMPARAAEATALALGQQPTVFPSNHGGFLGGEFGQQGEPEAFAVKLREVLDGGL
jgi:pimeloyl-ACP methyl ester carboxylesterase